jgi:hypothetical protein
MAIISRLPLPWRGAFRPFTLAGMKRGASRNGMSSPVPDAPAPAAQTTVQTISRACGFCGKKITEGEPTVQVRRATVADPALPFVPAHSRCFRAELLPRWY